VSPRQVVATGYGGPEHLEVREHDPGQPGPGQVLIDVRAIGVNAWDVKSYSGGDFGEDPDDLPILLGAEVAGVVVAGDLPEGQEVIAWPVSGGYADRVLAKVDRVVKKPSSMSWEQAAGLMLTGAAATHLVVATDVHDGDVVLLHGAAGGVGLFAAQLALHRGARVIGSALPDDHDVLRDLGVEPLDFRAGLKENVQRLAPEGVDVVLDAVGAAPVLDLSLEVVKDKGRIATLIPSPAATERGIKQLGYGENADPGDDIRNAARLQLTQAFEEGWLQIVVAETFPLEDAAAAHRALVGSHGAGKIVLLP
jgi:NADPH:quinone reductase-like Zn-dependent oxidoreductase